MTDSRTVALVVLALLATPAHAQVFPEDNEATLAGITSVDARVKMQSWGALRGDPDAFREAVFDRFYARLKAEGLHVGASATRMLVCNLSARRHGDVVAAYVSLELSDWEGVGVHRLSWKHGGIWTGTVATFKPETFGDYCADFFLREWRELR